MTRRELVLGLGAAAATAVWAAPAAADVAEAIAEQLAEEGYENIQIERTLLGRIRITAETATARREIVVDRGSGEILRDLTEEKESSRPTEGEGGPVAAGVRRPRA